MAGRGGFRFVGRAAFACLFVIVGLAATGAGHALAQSRRTSDTVTFQHRTYDVHILRNGDLQIAERWDAVFSGGPFDSATLGVYTGHTTGLTFNHVDGAAPDSERVVDVEDKAGNRIRQITWSFPPVHDATRTFTIPYTVHGALGIGKDRAWLDWHFLDGATRSTIPATAVTITITPPESVAASTVQAQAVYPGATLQPSVQLSGQVTLAASALNSGSSLETLVTFPRSALDASVQRPRWQRSDTPPTLPTPLGGDPQQETATTGSNQSGLGAFFSNFGLVMGLGLAILAALLVVAWLLARRLRRSMVDLTQSATSEEEPTPEFVTDKIPAVAWGFDKVTLPAPASQPEIEGFDLSTLRAAAEDATIDEKRGPGAMSGAQSGAPDL